MNLTAIKVIYLNEMMRFWNTLFQSIASPVISTALYFVVFGSAIGSRIENIEGVSWPIYSSRLDNVISSYSEHF